MRPAERRDCAATGAEATTKYKGVRKRKWGKWVAEIRLPNSRERIWLGSYDTPEKAARAFDAAVLCLRGRQAGRFNFPHDLPDIADGRQLSPLEIQAVAAQFANEGRSPAGGPASAAAIVEEPQHTPDSSDVWTTSAGTASDATLVADSGEVQEYLDLPFLGTMRPSTATAPDRPYFPGLFNGYDDFGSEFFQPAPPPTTGTSALMDDTEEGAGYTDLSVLWNFW